jgi:hypothetical protein
MKGKTVLAPGTYRIDITDFVSASMTRIGQDRGKNDWMLVYSSGVVT